MSTRPAAPATCDHDFTRITPTQVLFEPTALWRAQYAIEAAPPTAEEARLLGIATHRRRLPGADAPHLHARRHHHAGAPGAPFGGALAAGEFRPGVPRRWHCVDLRSCPSQPWRNGGADGECWSGPTRKPGACELSVAHRARRPVLAFPGGLRLRCGAAGCRRGTRSADGLRTPAADDEPVTFDGEATGPQSVTGPHRDLNLMARLREARASPARRPAVGARCDGRLPTVARRSPPRPRCSTSPPARADRPPATWSGTDDPDPTPGAGNQRSARALAVAGSLNLHAIAP